MFCECEAASPCFSNLKTRSDSRAEPSVRREAEHVNYCICLLGEACLITCQAFSVPISVHQANICWDSPDHNEGRMLLPRWPRRETFSEKFGFEEILKKAISSHETSRCLMWRRISRRNPEARLMLISPCLFLQEPICVFLDCRQPENVNNTLSLHVNERVCVCLCAPSPW